MELIYNNERIIYSGFMIDNLYCFYMVNYSEVMVYLSKNKIDRLINKNN